MIGTLNHELWNLSRFGTSPKLYTKTWNAFAVMSPVWTHSNASIPYTVERGEHQVSTQNMT